MKTANPFLLYQLKMEKLYTKTRFRAVNGWLEVETSDANLETKSLTHIKLDRISHLTREGPFGDYDHNGEPTEVWNVYINTVRPSSEGQFIKHVIIFVFRDELEAETFLMGVNSKLY